MGVFTIPLIIYNVIFLILLLILIIIYRSRLREQKAEEAIKTSLITHRLISPGHMYDPAAHGIKEYRSGQMYNPRLPRSTPRNRTYESNFTPHASPHDTPHDTPHGTPHHTPTPRQPSVPDHSFNPRTPRTPHMDPYPSPVTEVDTHRRNESISPSSTTVPEPIQNENQEFLPTNTVHHPNSKGPQRLIRGRSSQKLEHKESHDNNTRPISSPTDSRQSSKRQSQHHWKRESRSFSTEATDKIENSPTDVHRKTDINGKPNIPTWNRPGHPTRSRRSSRWDTDHPSRSSLQNDKKGTNGTADIKRKIQSLHRSSLKRENSLNREQEVARKSHSLERKESFGEKNMKGRRNLKDSSEEVCNQNDVPDIV